MERQLPRLVMSMCRYPNEEVSCMTKSFSAEVMLELLPFSPRYAASLQQRFTVTNRLG